MNSYAIKRPTFAFSLSDLRQAKTDTDMRLVNSPFAVGGSGVVFTSGAVPWKGKRGADFANSAPEGVVRGLSRAQDLNKDCRGVRGTVTLGGRKYTKFQVCQMSRSTKNRRSNNLPAAAYD